MLLYVANRLQVHMLSEACNFLTVNKTFLKCRHLWENFEYFLTVLRWKGLAYDGVESKLCMHNPTLQSACPKKGKGNVFANMLLLPIKLTCFRDKLRTLQGRVVLGPGIAAVSTQIQKKHGPLHSLQIKSFLAFKLHQKIITGTQNI